MIITSENLHPKDIYTSSFELSLARALQKERIDACLLSVFMMTPVDLLKAIIIKITFGLKKNSIADRFSLGKLLHLFFNRFLFGKKKFVLNHTIQGLTVWEGVGIAKEDTTALDIFEPVWVKTGMAAFETCYKEKRIQISHGHSRFLLGASLANAIKTKYGLPYVITDHSSYFLRNMISEDVIPSLKRNYAMADALTSVSNTLRQKVIEKIHPEKPICVIGNTLSDEYLNPVDFFKSKNEFTVIAAGGFDENKNYTLLIRAFAKASLPDSRLIIAGEGKLLSKLKLLIDKLNLNLVVLLPGKLSANEIRTLMLQSDILVVSSYVETFSVVTIEAHACGLPVIATNCGGPSELINHENGILLQTFEEEEMANAIQEIYRHRNNYSKEKIRASVLAKYSPEIIARKYINIYSDILNRNNNIDKNH